MESNAIYPMNFVADEIHLVKKQVPAPGGTTVGKFFPYTALDKEAWDKIENEAIVVARISYPRNPKHHRKFMALVSLVRDAVAPDRPQHQVLHDIKLLCELADVAEDLNGVLRAYVKSISWSAMSQPVFNEVYDRAVFECAKICNCSIEDLLGELDELASWGKCQHPECQAKATHTHHIFPGTFRRERSERMNLKVHICTPHHWASHGWWKKGRAWVEMDRVAKREEIKKYKQLWCHVLGVDFDEVWALVSSALPIGQVVKTYKLGQELKTYAKN